VFYIIPGGRVLFDKFIRSNSQGTKGLLCNMSVHYRDYKRPSLVPIPKHFNKEKLQNHMSTLISSSYLYLRLGILRGVFPSDVISKVKGKGTP
jgi:hypothetical protein